MHQLRVPRCGAISVQNVNVVAEVPQAIAQISPIGCDAGPSLEAQIPSVDHYALLDSLRAIYRGTADRRHAMRPALRRLKKFTSGYI